MGAGALTLGISLAICAAFTLALSMNVQQFALSASIKHRILARWGRDAVWVGGLLLYLVAQGFLVAALNYGPQTLISALFATVLLFDALIARFILLKRISGTDALGLTVILVAVMVCAFCGPTTNYEITVPFMKDCISSPMGALFTMASFMFVLMLTKLVFVFEDTYPLFRVPEVEELQQKNGVKFVAKPPKHVEYLMIIIYPLALAVVEMGGQTTLKGFMGLLINDFGGVWTSAMFWCVAITWLCCVGGTVYGLRKVYAKFETVECLPIEYGVNTVLCIFAGLIFYQEHEYVETNNLIMIVVSAMFVPVGVAIMVLGKNSESADPSQDASAEMAPSTPVQTAIGLQGVEIDSARASLRRTSRLSARGGLALLPHPRKSISELALGEVAAGEVAAGEVAASRGGSGRRASRSSDYNYTDNTHSLQLAVAMRDGAAAAQEEEEEEEEEEEDRWDDEPLDTDQPTGGALHGLRGLQKEEQEEEGVYASQQQDRARGTDGPQQALPARQANGDEPPQGRHSDSMTPWAASADKRERPSVTDTRRRTHLQTPRRTSVTFADESPRRIAGDGRMPIGLDELMPTLDAWENGGASPGQAGSRGRAT
jgi:hypothetical protein